MTAPAKELTKNATETTLNGAINNSVTTVTVTDGSVYPSTGNFRVVVESEIMLVTARSSNNLTVVRGQDGTTAASHADGKKIFQVITADGYDRLAADNIPLWGWSSLLPLNLLVDDDGVTVLAATDFTWQNQGSSTKTDEDGTILLIPTTSSGDNVRILERTAPSAPYSYIAAFQPLMPVEGSPDYAFFCLGFRESSTGKLTTLAVQADSRSGGRAKQVAVYQWTNATTVTTDLLAKTTITFIGSVVWLKVEDNNTNLIFYISMDGVEWIQIASASRTAHMAGAPNRVFWGCNNSDNGSETNHIRLVHWSRAS